MFKKILLGILAVFVIIIGISVATGGGEDEPEDTTASQPEESTAPEEEAPDTKKEAADTEVDEADEPGPMTVGNWEVVGKIKPEDDGLGDFTATFRVENTGDAEDTGVFTVNVLKGDDIMASMDCIGSPVAPGSIGTVDCISTDPFKKGWSEITIENSF
jgi:hypothetical protein